MMTHIETLKKLATRLGAVLTPLPNGSHLLGINGHAKARFDNDRLETMSEDEFRQIVEDASAVNEITPLVFVGHRYAGRNKSYPAYVEAK
jgi:hypothetical protein